MSLPYRIAAGYTVTYVANSKVGRVNVPLVYCLAASRHACSQVVNVADPIHRIDSQT